MDHQTAPRSRTIDPTFTATASRRGSQHRPPTYRRRRSTLCIGGTGRLGGSLDPIEERPPTALPHATGSGRTPSVCFRQEEGEKRTSIAGCCGRKSKTIHRRYPGSIRDLSRRWTQSRLDRSGWPSQVEVAEGWVFVRPAAEAPSGTSGRLSAYRHVVDRLAMTAAHEPRPRRTPSSRCRRTGTTAPPVVVPFVGEAHRDAVPGQGPRPP